MRLVHLHKTTRLTNTSLAAPAKGYSRAFLTSPAGLMSRFAMTLAAPMTIFSDFFPSSGTRVAMPREATTLLALISEPEVRNARVDRTSCCFLPDTFGAASASSRQHVPSTSLSSSSGHLSVPSQMKVTQSRAYHSPVGRDADIEEALLRTKRHNSSQLQRPTWIEQPEALKPDRKGAARHSQYSFVPPGRHCPISRVKDQGMNLPLVGALPTHEDAGLRCGGLRHHALGLGDRTLL